MTYNEDVILVCVKCGNDSSFSITHSSRKVVFTCKDCGAKETHYA